jgi:N-acetyl-anhydromuramoyl-L-alanine amidase
MTKPLWQAGWYRHARRIESPNFGERPAGAKISLVVMHSISLPPGVYQGNAIERFFLNQLPAAEHPYYAQLAGLEVSAHFVVRRAGELLQFVSCDKRAWHAGTSRFEAQNNCNDFSVGVELEGLEGTEFEAAQYDSLAALAQALAEAYPISAVTSHSVIAPGRKHDPGERFEPAVFAAVPQWRRVF